MKPYHTSFLRAAASMMLLCSLTFFTSQQATANCGLFTISTADSVWSFSAAAGGTQSRTLWVKNISDSTLVLDATIYTTSQFGLNHTQFTIAPGDTADIVITFGPPSTAAAGTVTANLRLAKHGTDCRQYLGLAGTVTRTNSGHDKVVTLSPGSVDFPAISAGADTCHAMYLMNNTGTKVTISSMTILNGHTQFTINPAFNGSFTIDSGAYYRFTVCYTADANHVDIADSLAVTYLSTGTTLHTIYSSLIGHTSTNTGGGDLLVADPHSFSFGSVAADSTVCRSVIVTNKSTATSVVVEGWNQCDSKDFTISPAFSVADTLAPGHSMTFTICFTPQSSDSGSISCNLTLKYFTFNTPADGKSLVVGFYGVKAGSNTIGHTGCLRTEQGSNYKDPVVVGGSASHTLYLINNTPNSITLNTFYIYGPDAAVFSIDSKQFPITVPANSTNTTLTYTFSPTSNSKTEDNAKVTFSLSGDRLNCDSAYAYLIGYVVHNINTVDTVVRPLFPNETRTLGVEGNGATVSTTFYFTNNLSVDCTVNKIYLATGKYFSITSTNPSPTPFVLHPGDNLTVVITYTATDKIVHHDSLMIDANHNLQAQGFELQGVQLGAASVNPTLPDGVAINVSPNPATDNVKVNMAGVNSADIQIYDLLGKTVTSAKGSVNCQLSTARLPTGSYIVRIAGQSASGEQFVASKRIIISK